MTRHAGRYQWSCVCCACLLFYSHQSVLECCANTCILRERSKLRLLADCFQGKLMIQQQYLAYLRKCVNGKAWYAQTPGYPREKLALITLDRISIGHGRHQSLLISYQSVLKQTPSLFQLRGGPGWLVLYISAYSISWVPKGGQAALGTVEALTSQAQQGSAARMNQSDHPVPLSKSKSFLELPPFFPTFQAASIKHQASSIKSSSSRLLARKANRNRGKQSPLEFVPLPLRWHLWHL